MDGAEFDLHRAYLISMCAKYRCAPTELSSLFSFQGNLNQVYRKMLYEEDLN